MKDASEQRRGCQSGVELKAASDSADPDYRIRQGRELLEKGELEAATNVLEVAADLDPDNIEVLSCLGVAWLYRGKCLEAIAAFRRVIALRPDLPLAYLNLGAALKAQGDFAGAEDSYRQVLSSLPENAEAHYNLGALLLASGKLEEAVNSYRRALEINPDWAEAHNSLGTALQEAGRLEEAIDCYTRAAQLKPGWHLPWHNLAEAQVKKGELERAAQSFRRSIHLAPGFTRSHQDLAYVLLQLGEFEQGWREHEWRWGCGGHTPGAEGIAAPLWDGSPLEGHTILLWSEQGLGDTIQFARYARLVHERGGRVWLQCPGSLKRLLATCPGVESVYDFEESVSLVDFQIPLMSLPALFGTRLDNIPVMVPYLSAPDCIAPALEKLLSVETREVRVGIVWASGTKYRRHHLRDCEIEDFRRLLRIPGLVPFSLQYGDQAQAARQTQGWQVRDLSPHLGDFATTGAIVEHMDLVITVDTAMAHLAGAMGKQVWTLLPHMADWRWLMNREDSPWYPTMRLFRQHTPSNWNEVFDKLEQSLLELICHLKP